MAQASVIQTYIMACRHADSWEAAKWWSSHVIMLGGPAKCCRCDPQTIHNRKCISQERGN